MGILKRLCIEDFCSDILGDLSNYYTKAEVNNLIDSIENVSLQVVSELPQTGETNIIYLVPKEGEQPDVYDEYIYVGGKWEKIGDTQINLSQYYTKDEINNFLGRMVLIHDSEMDEIFLWNSNTDTKQGIVGFSGEDGITISSDSDGIVVDGTILMQGKQDKLTAGDGINIDAQGVISAQGLQYTKDGTEIRSVVQNDVTNNVASTNALASGYQTKATGNISHTSGWRTEASGEAAHAEGSATTASGNASHAEGTGTVASGESAHAQNTMTIAASKSQTALGKYNISDSEGKYAVIVGGGNTTNTRKNIFTLDWDGHQVLADTLTVARDPVENMEVATKKYVDENAGGFQLHTKAINVSTDVWTNAFTSPTAVGESRKLAFKIGDVNFVSMQEVSIAASSSPESQGGNRGQFDVISWGVGRTSDDDYTDQYLFVNVRNNAENQKSYYVGTESRVIILYY